MSYTNLNYHIVYSTKDRRPFIQPEAMPRICEYTGGIIRELDGHMMAANGAADHMHVVTIATPKLAIMDFVRTIKTNSSKWVHATFPAMQDFDWQDGYSAFTVSHSALDRVAAYVQRQAEHHKKMTSQEELAALLQRHGIAYDEHYI